MKIAMACMAKSIKAYIANVVNSCQVPCHRVPGLLYNRGSNNKVVSHFLKTVLDCQEICF